MAKVLAVAPGERLSPAEEAEAGAAVKACRIVAFPTDTVYGLGCTGLVKAALRRLYRIKGRDAMKPLPILVHSTQEARRWVEWTPQAERLAARFWPGAVTLVLRPTQEGRLLTFQEFPTLGIRVPAHPTILGVLEAFGAPMASTSANLSGQPALASGAGVVEAFGDTVDLVIDAGETAGGESSVVDATSDCVRVLREGRVPKSDILRA